MQGAVCHRALVSVEITSAPNPRRAFTCHSQTALSLTSQANEGGDFEKQVEEIKILIELVEFSERGLEI